MLNVSVLTISLTQSIFETGFCESMKLSFNKVTKTYKANLSNKMTEIVTVHCSIVVIKPDMPINIYAWFCLSTAKSKFSLISPVAD